MVSQVVLAWRKGLVNAQTAPLSILWVEDDDGVANAFTRLLSSNGASVTRVKSIKQAEQALVQRTTYNAILLDLNLEETRGLDTLRKMREVSKSALPIIVLTGLVDDSADSMAQAAVLEGAQDWLTKVSVADSGPTFVRAIRMGVARDLFARAKRSV